MSTAPAADAKCFGYLSVVETDAGELVGGYLLIGPSGRPIEFHCTEAVVPTRAQQILFGPTLGGYLRGEVIGAALVRAASRRPELLLVDDIVLEIAGRLTDTPTTFVGGESIAAHAEPLDELSRSIDLSEPFTRIREAVAETQRFDSGEERHAA